MLRNDAVMPEDIAEGGFTATAEASARYETRLAVEDTTTLSYEHAVVAELGDLGGDARSAKRGFLVHSMLLLDGESGCTVGLIEQARWKREHATRGQRYQRREVAAGLGAHGQARLSVQASTVILRAPRRDSRLGALEVNGGQCRAGPGMRRAARRRACVLAAVEF